MISKLQCKDIPDAPILAMLSANRGNMVRATWWRTDDGGPVPSVIGAMPKGTPGKLSLAKMRQMIRRGVVSGCPCGCRGDFEITDKGLAELGQAQGAACE